MLNLLRRAAQNLAPKTAEAPTHTQDPVTGAGATLPPGQATMGPRNPQARAEGEPPSLGDALRGGLLHRLRTGQALTGPATPDPLGELRQAPAGPRPELLEAHLQRRAEAAAATEQADAEVDPRSTLRDAPDGTTRESVLASYDKWLQKRIPEVAGLTGDALVQRVYGLLAQVELVSTRLNLGTLTDISALDTSPTDVGQTTGIGFVPPELIATVRTLINFVQTEVDGATPSTDATAESSRYSNIDWNSRLGVPAYRSQMDNLVAAEAACNVTSTAKVLERLGYNREDVIEAIERRLKSQILRDRGMPVNPANLDTVELTAADWEARVKQYLDKNNGAVANYLKVLGRSTTNSEREALAEAYRDNAQMEDLLDFLVDMLPQTRYQIVGDPSRVLAAVEPDADARPGVEQLWRWDNDTRAQLRDCLDAGGAAILSFRHKGAGQSGTHLVSVQRVTSSGMVVDDPYGAVRESYRGNQRGDAFASPGSSRAASPFRNARPGASDNDAWTARAGQELPEDARRGESVTLDDAQLTSMFNRLTLYHRATGGDA